MNTFQKTCLLLFAASLLTACEQEAVPSETDKPTIAAMPETFTSGGYDMVVSLDGGSAIITTQTSSTSPESTDDIIKFVSNATEMSFSGLTYPGQNSSGGSVDLQLLNPPNDNRTYWAVPFESAQGSPVKIADAGFPIITIGISPCECALIGSGCESYGISGCYSPTGCSSCRHGLFMFMSDDMFPMYTGIEQAYTIVAADRLEYNGKLYE